MYELVYCEDRKDYNEIKQEITEGFPEASFEDGSDFVHEHRFAVRGEIDEDTFYRFALKKGFALCLLGFNILMREDAARVRKLMIDAGIPVGA